jgi:hypothetical protein
MRLSSMDSRPRPRSRGLLVLIEAFGVMLNLAAIRPFGH